MTAPSARFSAWIASTGLRQKALAKLLGCDPSYVSHIAAGRQAPGLRVAAAIERETRGAIKASDWARQASTPATPEAA